MTQTLEKEPIPAFLIREDSFGGGDPVQQRRNWVERIYPLTFLSDRTRWKDYAKDLAT